jgi:hypothetical protein
MGVEARERDAGDDASARARSTAAAAGPFVRTAISLKNRGVSTSRPAAPMAAASSRARLWFTCASWRRPFPPSSVMWIVKASAQRPELVQMLEVAFSRRMCCSRVDSVRT